MLTIPAAIVVLCVLFVWFGAEFLIVFYLYPALLDVYGMLSFEFQTIDTVRKNIKRSNSCHMNRLMNCIPLRIIQIKKRLNKDESFDTMVYSIVAVLAQLKRAELMEFPFADDEESLRHPLMRELDEDDIARYRQERDDLNELTKTLGSIAGGVSPDMSPKRQELSRDLEQLQKLAEDALQVEILCVKKLPFTGRPKRQKIQIITSPKDVMARVEVN